MKQVNQTAKNIDEGIKYMIDAMVEDYSGFNRHNKIDEVRDNMFNEYKNSGSYEINWNASSQTSGLYFIKLKTSKDVFHQKLMLIK